MCKKIVYRQFYAKQIFLWGSVVLTLEHTVEYMHDRASRLRVVGYTRIVAGVVSGGRRYHETAGLGGQLWRHVDAPVIVVVDHTVVVVPEHVDGRLGALS